MYQTTDIYTRYPHFALRCAMIVLRKDEIQVGNYVIGFDGQADVSYVKVGATYLLLDGPQIQQPINHMLAGELRDLMSDYGVAV
jgi:hypothetical protein